MELIRAQELLELHYLMNHVAINPSGYTTKHITVHEDLFMVHPNGTWKEDDRQDDTSIIISVHCTECGGMVKEK